MPPTIRTGPLNVLIALADPDLDVAQMLPALKAHYGLVCSTPAQAVEASREFEPQVVLIDCRVPDPLSLLCSIRQATDNHNIVFVAMLGATAPVPTEFPYSLRNPAVASDLESLLWRIGHNGDIGRRRVRQPGSERIG